jgi:uncharacterized membrane protein YvbJ
MNNIENPNFNNKKENETFLENSIQAKLVSKIYGSNDLESFQKWSENEAEIFRNYIENHPGYLVQYKDALDGEGNVDEIVERIERDILRLEKEIKPEV